MDPAGLQEALVAGWKLLFQAHLPYLCRHHTARLPLAIFHSRGTCQKATTLAALGGHHNWALEFRCLLLLPFNPNAKGLGLFMGTACALARMPMDWMLGWWDGIKEVKIWFHVFSLNQIRACLRAHQCCSTVKASRETNTTRRDIRSWLGNADCGNADEAYVTDLPAEMLPTPRNRKSRTTLYDSSTSSTSFHFTASFHLPCSSFAISTESKKGKPRGTTITTKPALKVVADKFCLPIYLWQE